jgi:tetratricopeptide (TPR) repeat protein
LHDLLRAYATELAGSQEAQRERPAALTRLFDHYVHTAHAADRLVHPLRDPIPLRLEPAASGTMVEPLADKDDAICWLSDERPVLLAAIPYAAHGGFDSRAWQLAWAFDTFLERRGDWDAQATAWRAALLAAGRLGDLPTQAFAHRTLAVAHAALEQYGDAERHFREALELATGAGDQVGQARTHCDLGFLRLSQGEPRRALHHAEQALALFRSAGHERGTATALNDLGWCHGELGDHRQAVEHCEQALAIFERLGERHGEASTWDSLGNAHHQLGDDIQAAHCYRRAIELHRNLGDDYFLADAIVHLGDIHHASGDPEAARAAWQEALEILTRIDHPEAEAVRAKLDGRR